MISTHNFKNTIRVNTQLPEDLKYKISLNDMIPTLSLSNILMPMLKVLLVQDKDALYY